METEKKHLQSNYPPTTGTLCFKATELSLVLHAVGLHRHASGHTLHEV